MTRSNPWRRANPLHGTGSRRRTGTRLAGLAVAAATLAGCSFGPNDLPSPRGGVSADYRITVRFASVMNLPAGADVDMNGLRVGVVESMTQRSGGVDVTVGLGSGTRVPAGARAVIQQNTLLGDTYIALTPDGGGSGEYLRDGGVIPVDRTTSPPQLEDTIAVLAYFVNGGSIQKIQDTMVTLNKTLPPIQDVRRLSGTMAVDLADLGRRTAEVDRTLTGLNRVSLSFVDNGDRFRQMFSAEGALYWTRVAHDVVGHISTLLPSVGSIFIGGMWLVPMLDSLADTVESVRMVWDKGVVVGKRLDEFLKSTLVPFAQSPRLNITSVRGDDGRELVGDGKNVLRILGAVR